jgi:hypothetical protein
MLNLTEGKYLQGFYFCFVGNYIKIAKMKSSPSTEMFMEAKIKTSQSREICMAAISVKYLKDFFREI